MTEHTPFFILLGVLAVLGGALTYQERNDPVAAAAHAQATRLGLQGCRLVAMAPTDKGVACGPTCWRGVTRYTYRCADGQTMDVEVIR